MEASFTQSLLNNTDSCSICVGSGDNYSSVNWRMIGTYDGTYADDGYSPFESSSYEQNVSEVTNVGGNAEFKVTGGHGYSEGDNIVLYGFTAGGNYHNKPKLTVSDDPSDNDTEHFMVKDENDNYILFDVNETGYTKIAPAYGEYKTILKINVPAKPYQDNLTLTKAEINLYNLAQYGSVDVQLLLQSSKIDTLYANTSLYGQTGQWQTDGIGSGDIETGADYGFGSNIYWTGFKKVQLDHIIEEEKIKWNTLKYVVLSLNTSYSFASVVSGTQSIEIEYFYEDPPPPPPAIKIESAGEKTDPSKGVIYQSAEMKDDVQGFISAWNTSPTVLSTSHSNSSFPFSDINKGEYKISQLSNGFLITEDTYYLKFFAYDNNSIGAYSTGSNKIKVKRDGIDTFTIIDKDKDSGGSIAVAETLFGYVIPDSNKTEIETLYIDWGDGTDTEMDFIYKTASLGGVPNDVITVDNTAPFTVGDYVAVQGSSYIIAEITSLTSTEITLSKDVDGISLSEVYLLPQHTYTASGEYSAYAQIKNKDNWWSDIKQVGTKPAPPAPNPVANIRASKIVCNTDETIYLNGALSYTNDLNDEILWKTGESVWSIVETEAGETFENANASNTSVSFSNAGTWTIRLDIWTSKRKTNSATLEIEVVEPYNYNFTGTVTTVRRTPVESGKLFSKLKEKGFSVKYEKKGGYQYEIRGIVRTVGEKNKLLGLGVRDYDTITMYIDGRFVTLYPTEKPQVNIPKGAKTPDSQPEYTDTDFYTRSDEGFWKFSLTGVELEGL